jgi:GNAT superfamily N-acetyltransferase
MPPRWHASWPPVSDDPVLMWVFHQPDRDRKLACSFDFLAREALVPLGATYLLSGSCAAWTPPGTPQWPAERGERLTATLKQVCTDGGLERLGVLDAAMEGHHRREPLWYLGVIATIPEAQVQGLGTALLQQSLAAVDATGLPGYLESTNPRNLSLYRRHSFETKGEITLPDGPSLTCMWRPAAAMRSAQPTRGAVTKRSAGSCLSSREQLTLGPNARRFGFRWAESDDSVGFAGATFRPPKDLLHLGQRTAVAGDLDAAGRNGVRQA